MRDQGFSLFAILHDFMAGQIFTLNCYAEFHKCYIFRVVVNL